MQPSRSPLNTRRAVVLAAIAFYWAALYLYGSTLPVYVQNNVADLAVVGGILSMYGLWQGLVRLPFGIAADWAGRQKPFIIAGLLITAAGAWGLGQSHDAGALTFTRALTGVGAATWVPLLVFFNGLFPPEQAFRITGLVTLVGTLARMASTGVNGPLNTLSGGYELAFDLAAAAGVVAILILLFVPEKRTPPRRPEPRHLLSILVRPDVLGPALLNLVIHYGDWAATFSFIPILMRQYGATDVIISTLTSANLGVVALGNFVVTWLGTRIRYQRILLVGLLLMCVGLGLAAVAGSLEWVVAAQLFLGAGFGLSYPTLLGACIRHVEPFERNTAMGLNQSVYAVGMFAGPWLSGIIANALQIQPMFAITAAAVLLGGLACLRWLNQKA